MDCSVLFQDRHHGLAAADVYKHSPSSNLEIQLPTDDQHAAELDVIVLTSGGLRIPVHSCVLVIHPSTSSPCSSSSLCV